MTRCIIFAALLAIFSCQSVVAKETLVSDQKQFNQVVSALEPGDTVVLANGVWQDFEMLFEGTGTADKPITLTAQEKGKIVISGKSNLRLAGEYLVVSGLVFKNGHTPTPPTR